MYVCVCALVCVCTNKYTYIIVYYIILNNLIALFEIIKLYEGAGQLCKVCCRVFEIYL